MNQKDVKELKKYFSASRTNVTEIHGALVNENGGLENLFTQDLYEMPEENRSRVAALFRKVMSGKVGPNLVPIDIEYGKPEQQMLENLMKTRLSSRDARQLVFDAIRSSIKRDYAYIILAAVNSVDIIVRGADDGYEDTETEFSCIVYAICPVKRPKNTPLYYNPVENGIYTQFAELNIGSPEAGFVYPAFEDASANISRVMYYTKDTALMEDELIVKLFAPEKRPLPADTQREDFNTAVAEALLEDCDSERVIMIHDSIRQWSKELEESEDEEPVVSGDDVAIILRDNGIEEEKVERFKEFIKKSAGPDARLSPASLVPAKDTYETANIKITVKPEFSDLIKTDIINGRKCILVYADDGVSVNGVNVSFPEDKTENDQ